MTSLPTLTPERARNARASAILLAGAKTLGLGASDEEGRILLGFSRIGVRAEVVEVAPQPKGVAVQVSCMVRGDPFPEGWHDQVAGVGPDEETAIARAVEGWCAGPLELLRDAFSSTDSEHRYELPQVGADGYTTTWGVFEGPLQLIAPPDVRAQLLTTCEDAPPFTALAEMSALPRFDVKRSHILKLFAARAPDGSTKAEVRLDSVMLPEAEKVLARFQFPEGTTYASLRQYFVLRPMKK